MSQQDEATACDVVSVTVAGQLFGIPLSTVQEVLDTQRITRIPLAPREVAGSLNLRGRIVTALDLRARLAFERSETPTKQRSVVVDHGGHLYSLLVDSVDEVLQLPASAYDRSPPNLDPALRDVATGIYRLEGNLMVVLNVDRLLELPSMAA